MAKKYYAYNSKQIEYLLKKAKKLKLQGVEILDEFTTIQLIGMCNGIGSESMPKWMRSTVSKLNPTLEVVAMIHDVEWSVVDKTKKHFKESNKRFLKNGYLAADDAYSWWDLRRYTVRRISRRFAKTCQKLGWKAYLSGKMEEYDVGNAEINNEPLD